MYRSSISLGEQKDQVRDKKKKLKKIKENV